MHHEVTTIDIDRIFRLQQQHQYELARRTVGERVAVLKKLQRVLIQRVSELEQALQLDFKKHPVETNLNELAVITGELNHTIRNLKRWTATKRVPTPLVLLGGRSSIWYEPKGVVLIMTPWNYPLMLTICPVISAIAAGNAVMVKPSEHAPHSAAVMSRIFEEVFEENELACIEGGVEVAQELLAKPFNHIFFTGSSQVGKIVMEAAARNLTSVTLELGGKSPAIIDETANLKQGIGRIIWGKYSNTGQSCIAPDYIMVHRSKKEEFLEASRKKIRELYGDNPQDSSSFARMIDHRHFTRMQQLLDDAVERGAKIEAGGQTDEADLYVAPTILSEVPADALVMQDEIFGPILPVLEYEELSEVFDRIRFGHAPLGLYIFSQKKSRIQQILRETRAGSTAINNTLPIFANHYLPFGGVNNSGVGDAHGYHSFLEFSNTRAIYRQRGISTIDIIKPPYSNRWKALLKWAMKWL
jgi:aldehyde dehydrogenase (NAD+)